MIRKLLLNIGLICFASFAWGKTGVLDRIITVDVKSTPIRTILYVIEQRASVQFSYNPDLIEEDKIVSLKIKQKTIAFGLALIFNKTVRFKEVGNHIVLLRNEDVREIKERKKSNLTTIFKGQITDKRTGNPIEGASIYDVEARFAAVSNSGGLYELEISNAETVRSLYIRKKGFKEFVFVVDARAESTIVRNIELEPQLDQIEKLASPETENIYMPIEHRALSGGLVSYDTYVHAENLEEIEESRIAQISLVPSVSIGSNLSTNGLITNNYSLNILAGYSSGVAGAEVGGIANMVKGDVKWFQAAGILNLVGGDLTGFQAGGIANSVRGDIFGVQVGGIANMTGGNFKGLQVGGIANLNHKSLTGVQVSGISSITIGNIRGVQISGIFSGVRKGFTGVQVAGISCLSDSTSRGAQISGIHNTSFGQLNGGQCAGISNFSIGGKSFIQVAGITNMARYNRGLQIGGIYNFARNNSGVQIGLINTSMEGNGIAIGLINFVLRGYHKTEVAANENFPLNITLKSGVRRFYNTYNFGVKFGEIKTYAMGLGFGSQFNLSDLWQISCDISGQMVFENNFESFEFAQLYKFSSTADYKIAKWLTVFAGPTFNANILQFQNSEGGYESAIGSNPISEIGFANGLARFWIGGQVGLRF